MVSWVVIGIIVVAVFIFFKVTSFRYERWWTYLIAVVLIFLLFSFFSVVRTNNIALQSPQGFISGIKVYSVWLVGFGQDAVKFTGQVTSIDWNVTQNVSERGP